MFAHLLNRRGRGTYIAVGGGTGDSDGGFQEPPIVTTTASGDTTIKGKVKPGSFGKFVLPVATLTAGRQYTFRYTPQFSQLAQQGRLAMVGFGMKTNNDFHIVGLRGDGSTGLHKYKLNGTPPNGWNKDTGHTTSDGGASVNGTQAGPNYIRLIVSADGTTYTFATSPNGTTWTNEYTASALTPFTNVSGVVTFGIALWFNNADAGPFSILIDQIVEAVATSIAYVGHAGGTSNPLTYTSAPIGTAAADRIICALVDRHALGNSHTLNVTVGGTSIVPANLPSVFYSGALNVWVEAWYGVIPTGTTADVVVTGYLPFSIDVYVYAIYGCSPNLVDAVTQGSQNDTAVELVDIQTQVNGFVLGLVSGGNNSITWTEAWTGSESVVENFDGASFDNNARDAAFYLAATSSLATNDITATLSSAQLHVGTAVSFGPSGGLVDRYTSNWHPLSRGDRTASITVTTTATLGSGTINNLVDGGFASNLTDAVWFTDGQTLREMKFAFGSARILNGLRWYQDTTNNHGTWAVYGSNDDSSYTKLSDNFTLGGAVINFYWWQNDTAYLYYKMLQSAGTTSSGPWNREVEFVMADASPVIHDAYEKGYRADRITVTTTATLAFGHASNLVDGFFVDNMSEAISLTNGESSKEIKFDLGVGVTKIITGMLWFQTTANSHGTWVMEASNNDSSYATLDTFTLGGVFTQERVWPNSTGYRYYKLRQTSGTTNSTPWIMEIEFAIGVGMLRLSDQYAEVIQSGNNNLVRLSDQYAEVIQSGNNNLVRLSDQYLEVIIPYP